MLNLIELKNNKDYFSSSKQKTFKGSLFFIDLLDMMIIF